MEKDFVPYEQALELKELGFDIKCIATITNYGYLHIKGTRGFPSGGGGMVDERKIDCPTFSQAFRWFREKYKISGEISSDYYLEGKDNEWEYNIYQLGKEDDGYVGTIPIFKTYEEAELECLKKLIEMVKGE